MQRGGVGSCRGVAWSGVAWNCMAQRGVAYMLDCKSTHPKDDHLAPCPVFQLVGDTRNTIADLARKGVLALQLHRSWLAETTVGSKHQHLASRSERSSVLQATDKMTAIFRRQHAANLASSVQVTRQAVLLDQAPHVVQNFVLVAMIRVVCGAGNARNSIGRLRRVDSRQGIGSAPPNPASTSALLNNFDVGLRCNDGCNRETSKARSHNDHTGLRWHRNLPRDGRIEVVPCAGRRVEAHIYAEVGVGRIAGCCMFELDGPWCVGDKLRCLWPRWNLVSEVKRVWCREHCTILTAGTCVFQTLDVCAHLFA